MGQLEPLEPGQTIDDRYLVRDVIGEGGYGLVYEAEQCSTGQRVAIKVLSPARLGRAADARLAVARFEREMRVIGQLQHPHIVRLIDSGHLADGGLYSVLEFIEGITLAEELSRNGPLDSRIAKRVMAQVADALTCAHELGIVHRDLKPQNIMISGEGLRRSAMVLDFGIAAIAELARDADYQTLTATGQVHGTPAYMAPEQLRDRIVTPQTDLYAWGLVMIEALTGARAFKGSSYAGIIYQQMAPDPVPIPPEVLRHPLGSVVARAVAKPLERRFTSAAELLSALEQVDASHEVRPIHTEPGGLPALAETVPDVPADPDAATRDVEPAMATDADEWSLGETGDICDEESTEPTRGQRSRAGLLLATGIVAVIVVVVVAGLVVTHDEHPARQSSTRPVPAPPEPSPPAPGEDLEIPIDHSPNVRVERLASPIRLPRSSDSSVPAESPGGTGPLLALGGGASLTVVPNREIALDRMRLDLYFNSNKLHTATYDLVNTSQQPVVARIGVPVELVCRTDPPGPCLQPSPTEHTLKVDGQRVEGELVGPLSGDRQVGRPADDGLEIVGVETLEAVGDASARTSAERYGYDYLVVLEVSFAPGQRRTIRDHFPRSGTVEGVAPTLGFPLAGASSWGGGAIGELEVRVDFGGPTSPCLFTNLPASMRGRRLAINARRPSQDTDVVVRWVQPETLVEAELLRHPGLALQATDATEALESEALDAVLRSKGEAPLVALYDAILLAYRGREPLSELACRPVSMSALTDDGALTATQASRDENLRLDEVEQRTAMLLTLIAAELRRRGLQHAPLPLGP